MTKNDIYAAMARNKAKKIFAEEEEEVRETTWSLCKQYDTKNKRREKVHLINFVTIGLAQRFGDEIENLFRIEWQKEVDIFCKKYAYDLEMHHVD